VAIYYVTFEIASLRLLGARLAMTFSHFVL
jgi:hypothetical protein